MQAKTVILASLVSQTLIGDRNTSNLCTNIPNPIQIFQLSSGQLLPESTGIRQKCQQKSFQHNHCTRTDATAEKPYMPSQNRFRFEHFLNF
jgi:hypothetical protein